jgi:hypothetical protein
MRHSPSSSPDDAANYSLSISSHGVASAIVSHSLSPSLVACERNTVLRPLGIKLKPLAALHLGTGDWHKVLAYSSGFDDFAGDALVGEAEMSGRLTEGRIDDRVVTDDLAHL